MEKEHKIKDYGFGSRTKEIDDEIRTRAKGSASDKRKIAQKIRRLKEIENPDEFEKRCMELINNPKLVGLTIFQILEEIKNRSDLTPKLKLELSRAYADSFRTIFGTKNFNFNINKNIDSAKNMTKLYQICQQEKQEQEKEKDKKDEEEE